MTFSLPLGFRLSGLHCGIKEDSGNEDLALVVSDVDAVGVGTFTRNRFAAAPVRLDRSRTPSAAIRGIVINSGNANACTGDRGDRDARQMARIAADACQVSERQMLVLSTGVIGQWLPMQQVGDGIVRVASRLGADETSVMLAARGMMTTDTHPKVAWRLVGPEQETVHLLGLAKGAAMIGPNMATMLAVLLTDAALDARTAQQLLCGVVDRSFNAISVDGHTSTNDTVLLLANGRAGTGPLQGRRLDMFRTALQDVCGELAEAIVADGEGATHTIEVEVTGCATHEDARRVARTVANSPLVKTAVTGADPNWGRFVSAAGYAGVDFDPAHVSLQLNGVLLFDKGAPVEHDADEVSESLRTRRDVKLKFMLQEGEASDRFWTTNLTAEYVRLNADYRT